MPKYVARALHKFQQALQKFHPNGFNTPEYSPHKHVEPNYVQKVQYAEPTDNAPPLDYVDINLIQNIVGKFLYYGIAVDNTILVALSTISSENLLPHPIRQRKSPKSSTTSQHTQIQPSNTHAVIWSYGSTLMITTCPAQKNEADQGARIF